MIPISSLLLNQLSTFLLFLSLLLSSFKNDQSIAYSYSDLLKIENPINHRGPPSSLLPQNPSLSQKIIGQESQTSAYLENLGLRRGSQQGQCRLSEVYIKSSYMNDPPVKLAKEIPTQSDAEERKSVNDPLTTESLNKSPDLQALRRRHQDHITQAFDELLNYKPQQDGSLSKREKERTNSYNNILKDIDECVNDMKKYSARAITSQDDALKIDNEMIEELGKKKLAETLRSSNLRENNVPSYTNLPEKLSSTLPKMQQIYEDQYKIGEFLPGKTSNKNENTERIDFQDKIANTVNLVENKKDSLEGNIIRREENIGSKRIYPQELYTENFSRSLKVKEIENKVINPQINTKIEQKLQATELGEKNNKLMQLISSNISKEQLENSSDNIVETLSKALIKIINSNPNLFNQKVNFIFSFLILIFLFSNMKEIIP